MVYFLIILLAPILILPMNEEHLTSFWADGGEMNYYFFYGPKISQVVEAYTDLDRGS